MIARSNISEKDPAELAKRAKKVKLSPSGTQFVQKAADFIENYLPLERPQIIDILAISLDQMQKSYNLSIDDLLHSKTLANPAFSRMSTVLKKYYREVLVDEEQIPFVDICVDGLLHTKSFWYENNTNCE
jgi:hypothetical protein